MSNPIQDRPGNPHRRLRAGLFLKLLASSAVVALVVGLLVTFLAGRATRQQLHLLVSSVGQRQAERIAPLLAAYYEIQGSWEGVEEIINFRPGDMSMPPQRWDGMMKDRNPVDMWRMMGTQILIVDTDGEVVAATEDEDLIGAQVDAEGLAAGAPIELEGEIVGTALVTVGAFTDTLNDQFLERVNRATLLATLIAGAVAIVVGGLVTWTVTRPMRELTQATRAIAAGDLSQRVVVQGNDEIGDLANAFNQMAAELERGESLRRQMTADIAHELRTPLSVIQGNVEALQDGVFPLTVAALDPIQAKTELLSRLVEDLRNLALADAGQMPMDRQPTDLEGLVRQTVVGFQPAIESKAVTVSVAAEGDTLADADPQRIEQVLVNLLSNALRHTPEQSEVRIDITRTDTAQVCVRVTDSGPGIPDQQLEQVFERFFRGDRGRARGGDGDGTGLGLAVARSIIKAHGGNITVENAAEAGASFCFTLPAVVDV